MAVTFETPVCGCLGCHEPAVVIVTHPEHGPRAVCDDHAADYPVREEL